VDANIGLPQTECGRKIGPSHKRIKLQVFNEVEKGKHGPAWELDTKEFIPRSEFSHGSAGGVLKTD
jgi:hypothetical protein